MFVRIGIQYINLQFVDSILDLRPNNVQFVFGRKCFEYIGILIIKIVVCLNKFWDLCPNCIFLCWGETLCLLNLCYYRGINNKFANGYSFNNEIVRKNIHWNHVISFLWIAPGHCQIVVGAQMFVDIGIQYIIYSMLNSILDLRPNNVRFVFGRKFFDYIGILIIKIVVCLNMLHRT